MQLHKASQATQGPEAECPGEVNLHAPIHTKIHVANYIR